MAQCKLTPREFISNAFSPQIATVCSTAADVVCQKNNLSFVELLQPFCKLNTEGHFKDLQGNTVSIRNLRLFIQDVNAQPPEPIVARKLLNDAVSSSMCEHTTSVKIGTTELDIPVSVPWFEAWREMFLNVQFPSDHEFTKHFLACMIVVSTSEDSPLDKIQQMGAQLHQNIPGKLPKWFNNNTLRYYVLVHDTLQDDRNKAETVFAEMKNIYGANNCFLLQMNSRPPGQSDENSHLPDPWSQFLVRHADTAGGSEQNSSPRTPADTSGVSAMPNEVTTDSDKTSQAGTPVAPQSSVLTSPDLSDTVSFSSETSQSQVNQNLEVGQEAVSVTVHPLSPTSDKLHDSLLHGKGEPGANDAPINVNVWANSPNYVPIHHGARLSMQDLERLRALITEFCLKSLLPYVEKQIGLLSDVISNKKGVSRSLFSATRRWFGTNKPGIPGPTPPNAVIYTTESPELQLRRLGDLCFMFGHYSLAYQTYHSAKRDFAADQAWLYYAGALEMAALSAFMQDETNRKTIEYMDDAILTYLTSCKMPQFATRATLLSAECLKGKHLYGEAAKQLIRMTSEDSDLRSALLLEQAAYCFIGPKMMRKYAFHAVLAGHRFSKAGQKKHSLRCYQQAYQVYNGKGWSLAEDHIHFTIGRQAASLKQVQEAAKAFEKLLNAHSKQPAVQQAAFLREFLHIHSLLLQDGLSNHEELPILPLPLIDSNDVKVLHGPIIKSQDDVVPASHVSFDNEECDEVRWSKLEEMLITEAQGSPPMIFKPTIALYSKTSNNSVIPNAVLNEPVHFFIELCNPLHIPLPLSNVTLLWLFNSDDEQTTNETKSSESVNSVDTQVMEKVILPAASKQSVVLRLVPKKVGHLKVLGLSYDLSNPTHVVDPPIVNPSVAISGKILFDVKGPKLKNLKERPGVQLYGTDYRLEMNIVKKAPYMQILFSKSSSEMLCGEIQKLDITLTNVGNSPLANIYLASTDGKLFSLGNEYTNKSDDNSSSRKSNRLITKIPLPSDKDVLNIGESHTIPFWIRAPYVNGSHRLDLLFYYENVETESALRHRLCRHTWHFTVFDSMQISSTATRSVLFKDASPTLNLIICIKNANQVHQPIINEILLSKVLLRNNSWSVFSPSVLRTDGKIQPQEMFHLMLKLRKKHKDEKELTSVSLTRENEFMETDTNCPYVDFIQRRDIPPLDINENITESQQQSKLTQNKDQILSAAITLNSTLILKWRANIVQNGVVVRRAIGQHYLDIEFLNKNYKHPKEIQIESSEYDGHLKIFGPDKNIPNSLVVINKEQALQTEYLKNVISFSLSHVKGIQHNFNQRRLCFVPVVMYIQNHLESQISIKVNTIGTSRDTQLPNIKSQLYTPQASTYYRYACHSAICSYVEPLASRTVTLNAVIPAPGTYDLAARVEVLVRIVNTSEYVLQKWKTESICIVNSQTD